MSKEEALSGDERALLFNPDRDSAGNEITYKGRQCTFRIEDSSASVEVVAGEPIEIVMGGVLFSIPAEAGTHRIELRPRACIFDLDGVVADSAPCHYRAWKAIADKLGIEFDEEKNHLLRGVSRRRSLEIMADGQVELSEEDIEKCMTEKNEIYKGMIATAGMSLLLPGAREFLKKLRRAGLKIALASASRNAKTILRNIGMIDGYFDAIADGTDTSIAKPDPAVFLMAAKRVNAAPSDCLVFEDAPAGVDAAIAGKMGSVGVGPAGVDHADIREDSLEKADVYDVFEFFGRKG